MNHGAELIDDVNEPARVDAVLAKALKLPDLTRLRMMLGREPFVCGEALLAPREEGRRPPSPQAELLNS